MADFHPLLLKLIKEKSIKIGDFTLSSGTKSKYFIDLKPTTLHPQGALLIADTILDELRETCENIDAFGGMAMGAIPIVSVLASRSFICHPIPGFFVRPAPKGQGTNLLIEGCLERGMRAVLIEDVTTTGESVLQAVHAVRTFGAYVSEVITVIDRLEGARENLSKHGVTLTSILTREDLFDC
jgi:orotate phosphoribosyltransferase